MVVIPQHRWAGSPFAPFSRIDTARTLSRTPIPTRKPISRGQAAHDEPAPAALAMAPVRFVPIRGHIVPAPKPPVRKPVHTSQKTARRAAVRTGKGTRARLYPSYPRPVGYSNARSNPALLMLCRRRPPQALGDRHADLSQPEGDAGRNEAPAVDRSRSGCGVTLEHLAIHCRCVRALAGAFSGCLSGAALLITPGRTPHSPNIRSAGATARPAPGVHPAMP